MSTQQHSEPLAKGHAAQDVSHEHHHVNYQAVFIALCVCTALSIIFDLVSLPKSVIVVLVLAVAVAKALFVLTYFMHLKFEGRWKWIILAPTTILAIGLVIALAPDIGLHYYTPDVPQLRALNEARNEQLATPPAAAPASAATPEKN